ncbi:hypothetical protein EV178_000892 [Coemansia sp. RSA 1646]|nr:hypothetical protein EV178_000892 [Coemansia sp. RSA 1646]KAJ1772996.1 hypothetical protein LPJ74_000947 [Coemansia sp. RSA 1843]KAJ2092227.1 hypothetical protein IW138_001294 [Coemansia sp. RSA 986]KAJ2211345.1 hypothetical protein EV179_005573 [Coemansia sp. RSA 487]
MYVTGRHGLTATEALEDSEGSSIVWLCLHGRLFGGKGGFGSMLRSQGNKMSSNKPENYDDCRDLYGRRLKTLKEAKSIVDKLEAEEEAREFIKERRRKKIQDGLRGTPAKKYRFDDVEYVKSCEQVVEATKSTARKAMKRKMLEEKREQSKRLAASSESDKSVDDDENANSPSLGPPLVPLFDGDIADLSDTSSSNDSGDGSESSE